MNKQMRYGLSALLIVLTAIGMAYGWGASSGDGSYYGQNRETAVFFNNHGSSIPTGSVVVLDTGGTGVTAGTTLGAYVKMTTDTTIKGIVGVSLSPANVSDQMPIVVVTKGTAYTRTADSGQPMTTNDEVTTSATAAGLVGKYNTTLGSKTSLGIMLETGDATNTGSDYIWVNPDNN